MYTSIQNVTTKLHKKLLKQKQALKKKLKKRFKD
jgi:ribosome-associated translation inhibitor RaiA